MTLLSVVVAVSVVANKVEPTSTMLEGDEDTVFEVAAAVELIELVADVTEDVDGVEPVRGIVALKLAEDEMRVAAVVVLALIGSVSVA